jgi:tetratricopeptide (TPR) repeat protein
MEMRWKVILTCGIIFLFARDSFSKVQFIIPDSSFDQPPSSVSVVGTFNSWNLQANRLKHVLDAWTAELELKDGRYYYKYCFVDSGGNTHWMLDPLQPYLADNGIGGANNVLDVQKGEYIEPKDGMQHLFDYQADAKKVELAGDFNDWRQGQFPLYRDPHEARWHCWIELQRPFTYKFVADGIWEHCLTIADPKARVPDGFGTHNSYCAAPDPDPPETAATTDVVKAGDSQLIERIKTYERQGDYPRAITLARLVAAENERERGPADPIRQAALFEEARIHKRWAKFDRAAAAFQKLADMDIDTTVTRRAVWELSGYYTFTAGTPAETRRVTERALKRMPYGTEYVKLAARHLEATYTERQYGQVVIEADYWLKLLPPPEGREAAYACQLSEILLFKAYAQRYQGQPKAALATCEELIRIHPFADSQNVLRAKEIVRSITEVESSRR